MPGIVTFELANQILALGVVRTLFHNTKLAEMLNASLPGRDSLADADLQRNMSHKWQLEALCLIHNGKICVSRQVRVSP